MLVDCGFEVRIKSFLDDCIFYISVDYDKMSRVFENLISNIRKYADDQYPVEFELELIKQDILLRQVNKIHENHEKNVESHHLGLKSVNTSLIEMGGSLSIRKENNIFTLEIRLPIC